MPHREPIPFKSQSAKSNPEDSMPVVPIFMELPTSRTKATQEGPDCTCLRKEAGRVLWRNVRVAHSRNLLPLSLNDPVLHPQLIPCHLGPNRPSQVRAGVTAKGQFELWDNARLILPGIASRIRPYTVEYMLQGGTLYGEHC